MKIYQIILGNLPPYLNNCVESVKSFAKRNNFSYDAISNSNYTIKSFGNSLIDNFFYNRTISEWIRLDLLSNEKNILVVDWDIFLYDTFENPVGDLPIFTNNPMECMIYNGKDLTPFKKIKECAGNIENSKAGHMVLIESIKKYLENNPKFKYKNFDYKTYKHLDNCRLMQ